MLCQNADIAIVGRPGVLVRHLQEDEIGELLQVVAIAHAVVAQRGAEAPDPGDDRRGVHVSTYSMTLVGSGTGRPSSRSPSMWKRMASRISRSAASTVGPEIGSTHVGTPGTN